MHLLFVAATPYEIAPLIQHLEEHYEQQEGRYRKGHLEVEILVTGVGLMAATFQLTEALSRVRPQLAIQLGVAGALDKSLTLGAVYQVSSEQLGDLGVEERDGSFTDAFDLGLLEVDGFPFQQKKLLNPVASDFSMLPQVSGLTVHQVTGSQPSIEALQQRSDAQIESMEGAAFFYVCLQKQLSFLEIRAISNYVEPRDRANWKLAEAIAALNEAGLELLKLFERLEPKPEQPPHRPPGFYVQSSE